MARQKITPFLWFDDQAEEAAKFYTSIFQRSKILNVARYGKEAWRHLAGCALHCGRIVKQQGRRQDAAGDAGDTSDAKTRY
jgi:predicted 3-demethylubiquinone-9 3-methyltransferase (glyoxalase superfamily)